MKKVIFLSVLMLVVTFSSSVFSQTNHEKRQLSILESEIDKTQSELVKLEKEFQNEKKMEIFELKKQIRNTQRNANPRVATDFNQPDLAKAEIENLNSKIDSIDLVISTFEIDMKIDDLENLQAKRTEMIDAWVKPENSIPKEMRASTKNRRQRSNVVRREELVLSKIESNINQQVAPASSGGGYKIIFDNQYSLNTTFVLKGIDGGQRLAVSVAPRTKERHFVVPGNYLVEYYVGGRKSPSVTKLTVDGETHYYETEPCFGFAYKSRY